MLTLPLELVRGELRACLLLPGVGSQFVHDNLGMNVGCL